MGFELMKVAHRVWAPVLSDVAYRVLMEMCLTAFDEPTDGRRACHYYASPAETARCLGPAPKRKGSTPGVRTPESAERAVERALKELRDAGAVQQLRRGHRGARREYLITVDNWADAAARRPGKPDSAVPHSPTALSGKAADSPTALSPKPDSAVAPRTNREPTNNEETTREPTSPAPDATAARAREPVEDDPAAAVLDAGRGTHASPYNDGLVRETDQSEGPDDWSVCAKVGRESDLRSDESPTSTGTPLTGSPVARAAHAQKIGKPQVKESANASLTRSTRAPLPITTLPPEQIETNRRGVAAVRAALRGEPLELVDAGDHGGTP